MHNSTIRHIFPATNCSHHMPFLYGTHHTHTHQAHNANVGMLFGLAVRLYSALGVGPKRGANCQPISHRGACAACYVSGGGWDGCVCVRCAGVYAFWRVLSTAQPRPCNAQCARECLCHTHTHNNPPPQGPTTDNFIAHVLYARTNRV